jgi:glycosyltransferase involved in cell wall biosynthesis
VATDLEGNPELVTHGVTGLLVPPRRADALARALLQIIADRPAACAMALEGQRRVEAQFSTAVKVQRAEALYRRLLAEASTQQPVGDETRGHDAGEALE